MCIRDSHHRIKEFSAIKVGEMIKIRVIGQRYELNDEFISVIGELLLDKSQEWKIQKEKEIEKLQLQKRRLRRRRPRRR